MQRVKSLKAVLMVVVLTGVAKFVGFFREMAMAGIFGTGIENDSFLMAYTLPYLLFGVIAGSLETALIPVSAEVNNRDGQDAVLGFINKTLILVALLTWILIILGYVLADVAVQLMAPGFDPQAKLLTVNLYLILLPVLFFYSITSVYTGYLQANFRFTGPALMTIPMNLVVVAYIFIFSASQGIYALAWGYTAGAVIQLIVLIIPAFRSGYRFRIPRPLLDQNIIKLGVLIIPMFIGLSLTKVYSVVNRLLASGLPEGSISALHFAQILMLFPHAVFSMALSTVAYPGLSRSIAQKNLTQFRDMLNKWVGVVLLFVFPIAMGFLVLKEPLTRLVYQRGQFDVHSTFLTSVALQYYVLGLPALGLKELLARAYYSVQDTRTPMINGLITLISNIALAILLIKPLGHGGLALATSISVNFTVILYLVNLKKRKLYNPGRSELAFLFKIILATGVMGLGVSKINNILPNLGLNFLLAIITGVVLYVGVLGLLFWPIIMKYVEKKRLLVRGDI